MFFLKYFQILSGGLGLLNTNYARVCEAFSDASIAVTLMAHQSIGLKVSCFTCIPFHSYRKDQSIISLYRINTQSNRHVMRIMKNLISG